MVSLIDWIFFLREQLNSSLLGAQSQNQSASYFPRSNNAPHFGPISDGHPSWPPNYPIYMQSGQAQLLQHNQHMLGTEAWARLRPSPNLPTYSSNTSESCLHSYSYNSCTTPHPAPISWPRSLTATALPYSPDEHRTSHSTNALSRTSFSNLNARWGHDGHQRTSVDYPLSRPPGFSFSIDESTLKYHDAYMHSDDNQGGYNRYFIYLSPVLNLIECFLVFVGCSGNACQPQALLDQLCHLIHLSMIYMMFIRTTLILKVLTISLTAPSFLYLECTKAFFSPSHLY